MSTFNHVSDIGQRNVLSSLEDNLKSFLDWGFLNIGGFIDSNIPPSGSSGSSFLKLVNDPSFVNNTVWESQRKDWVYENEVVHSNRSPINISGIYLNNTFLPAPSGSGNYSYYINYPMGRIVFNNPVSPQSTVKLNYSYRFVQTYKANDSVWWKELQDYSYFKNKPDSNILANHRIELPAIIIETVPRTVLTPYELGTSENIVSQDILLHIFTDNPVYRNSLIDTLLLQKDKVFYLNNITKILKENVNSLNYRGEKNNSRLNFAELQNNSAYFLKKCFVRDSLLSEINTFSANLYNGIVRWTIQIFP